MLVSQLPPPCVEMKSNNGRATPARMPAVESETRMLIVDQDRGVGMALSFMLAARRYDDVRAVRSAERAIEIAGQFRPEIIFLDFELPDSGNVIKAMRLARDAHQSRPRLIALTKDAQHPMREHAHLAGFERFLVKPVSPKELDKILGVGRTAT